MVVSWWMSGMFVFRWPQFHAMVYEYMFIRWFGVDVVVVELGVWCDSCEKPNISCRILRDPFMSYVEYAMKSH